jgi:hypothetical protein
VFQDSIAGHHVERVVFIVQEVRVLQAAVTQAAEVVKGLVVLPVTDVTPMQFDGVPQPHTIDTGVETVAASPLQHPSPDVREESIENPKVPFQCQIQCEVGCEVGHSGVEVAQRDGVVALEAPEPPETPDFFGATPPERFAIAHGVTPVAELATERRA